MRPQASTNNSSESMRTHAKERTYVVNPAPAMRTNDDANIQINTHWNANPSSHNASVTFSKDTPKQVCCASIDQEVADRHLRGTVLYVLSILTTHKA